MAARLIFSDSCCVIVSVCRFPSESVQLTDRPALTPPTIGALNPSFPSTLVPMLLLCSRKIASAFCSVIPLSMSRCLNVC